MRTYLRGAVAEHVDCSLRAPSDAMMFAVQAGSKRVAEAIKGAMQLNGVRVVNEGASIILMPQFRMELGHFRQIASALERALEVQREGV